MSTILKEIKIDRKLLESISEIAKREGITEHKALTEVIEKGIESKRKNKISNYLIANNDSYDLNLAEIEKMAGMFTTDKSFDGVELVRELRSGDFIRIFHTL